MKLDVREFPLIAFTILAQLAVGAFWALMTTNLCLVSRFGGAYVGGEEEGISWAPLVVILATMSVSLGVTLAHLGSPWIAYKAIANLRTSWLSREIATANLFVGMLAIFAGMQWLGLGSSNLRAGIGWLTVLSGALLLYAMSRVYMLRTVPIWNTVHTPLSFFLSALVLGPLALGVVFAIGPSEWLWAGSALDANVLPTLATLTEAALVFLGIEFLAVPVRVVALLSGSVQQKRAVGRLFEAHRQIFFARLAASLLGAGVLIAMLVHSRYTAFSYALGFILILTAELLDRYLFYAAREASRL